MTYPHVDPEHEPLTDEELDARAEALWQKLIIEPTGSWAAVVARCRAYAAAQSARMKAEKAKE